MIFHRHDDSYERNSEVNDLEGRLFSTALSQPREWVSETAVFDTRDRTAPPTADQAFGRPLRSTVFHEDWWLDIATDGRWARVSSEDGRASGSMPYHIARSGPFRRNVMPPFTHFLGPVISTRAGAPPMSFNAEVEVTLRLIDELPPSAHFRQKFHGGIAHTVAFQMRGYKTSVQFTIVIAPRSAPALWNAIKPRTRGYIRNAERSLTVDETMSATAFCSFYDTNLRARGQTPSDDLQIAGELIDACRDRGRGYLLVARDPVGEPKAAIFCVSDPWSTYYLLTSRTRDSCNGAVSLLIWHAIQRAAAAGLIFDFDGIGHQSSIQFYSSFGGTCEPRYTVRRSSGLFALAQFCKSNLSRRSDAFTENN